MKKILFLVLLSGACYNVHAQGQAAATKAQKAAAIMGKALVDKDYKTFVKSTHPKAVDTDNGGYERLAMDIERQVKNMEQLGNKLVAITPGKPSKIVDTAGELQCTIPQAMVMTMPSPKGKVTTHTTLVGMSPDKGETWYFIDAAGRNIDAMRNEYATLSSKLNIPADPQPTFEADK